MRIQKLLSLTVLSVLLHANVIDAQCLVSPSRHPWGRFPVGSSKCVQISTETIDNGSVVNTSTTETKTFLVEVSESSYTLRVDVQVEVAGKRLASKPRVLTKTYSGENLGQAVSYKKLRNEMVIVDGRRIPSEVNRLVVNETGAKRITTVHYSDQVSPHVLRRVTERRDDTATYKSKTDVVSTSMPYRVLADVKTSTWIKSVHERPNGKTETIEVHSPDVPGGVVAHTSQEFNTAGELIGRSTLKLVDFNVPQTRGGPIRRWLQRITGRRSSR